jgi:F-type H+-transporting ATPase subunit b
MTSFFLISLAQAAPQAPEPQLLDIDRTVFLQLGLFFLTAFLLTRLLWRPYLKVRSERVSRVEGFREEASRLETEASARLARVEAQLAEARRTGSAERARARAEAQTREAEIVARAQAEAQRALAGERSKVEAAMAAERARLDQRAATLGREIAERVLGRPVAS